MAKKGKLTIIDVDEVLKMAESRSPERLSDDLEELERKLNERKLKRLMRLELEKEIRELERELRELSQEEQPRREQRGEADPALLELAKRLADLPEDKRARVIETYMALKSASSGDVAPLLLLMAREGSGSVREYIEILRQASQGQGQGGQSLQAIAAVASKALEVLPSLLSTLRQGSNGQDPAAVIRAFVDAFKELRGQEEQPPAQVMAQADPAAIQAAVREAVKAAVSEVLEKAGGQGVDPEIKKLEIELEKYRIDRQVEAEIEKQRLELEKKKQEVLATALSQYMPALGALASRIAGQGQGQGQDMEMVTCPSCGRPFMILRGVDQATCPYCGAELRRG